MSGDGATLVIGIGNASRSDDGAGPYVARRLALRSTEARVDVRVCTGDPIGLIAAWDSRDRVIVVDAARSGSPPGTVHRYEANGPLPSWLDSATSTHAVGLAETVALARAIGRLPANLVIVAVEGERFDPGDALSDPVLRACDRLVESLVAGRA